MEDDNMEMRFPLILDGATGTQLQKRGYQGDVSAEQWVLDHPDSIQDVQRRYVQAGSQIVYAPTFGANRQKLEERSIFNQTAEYNRRLTALSQQAVEAGLGGRGHLPHGPVPVPPGGASFEELVDIYAEQAAGLEQAGVDLFVVETMMTLADARAAVLAIRSVSDRPIFCHLHLRRERALPVGHRRGRRAGGAPGHGGQRLRPELLHRPGTDAETAAPPGGTMPGCPSSPSPTPECPSP